MSDFNDIIEFTQGKINYDTALELLPKGDSRLRKNIVPESDGQSGKLVNIKGNEKQDTGITFSDTGLKIIGQTEDKENNAIVYFVKGNTYDYILRLNYDETITKILWEEDLSFDGTITSYVVGSEDKQLLIFNDVDNGCRMITIPDVINYTNRKISATAYANDGYDINLIASPPVYPLNLEYFNDDSKKINNLRGVNFQFAYKYIYSDNRKSVLSPYSDIPIPEDFFIRGEQTADVWKQNTILISPNDSEPYNKHIVRAEIFYREADVGGGAFGDWLLYDTVEYGDLLKSRTIDNVVVSSVGTKTFNILSTEVDKVKLYTKITITISGNSAFPANTFVESITELGSGNYQIRVNNQSQKSGTGTLTLSDFIFPFRRDKYSKSVSQTDLARTQDYVPLKSDALTIVESNRIVLGGNTEGFDNEDIEIRLELDTNELTPTQSLRYHEDYWKIYKNKNTASLTKSLSGYSYTLHAYKGLHPPYSFIATNYINPSSIIDGLTWTESGGVYTYDLSGTTPVNHTREIYDSDEDEFVKNVWLKTDNNDVVFSYHHPSGQALSIMWDFFKEKIDDLSDADITSVTTGTNGLSIIFTTTAKRLSSRFVGWNTNVEASPQKTFKSGAIHYFAIGYKDEYGRRGNLLKSEDMQIYIPSINDTDYGLLGNNTYNKIKFNISSDAPSWATHYGVYYAGSNIQSYFKTMAYSIGYADDESLTPDIEEEDNGLLKINVNRIIIDTQDALPNSNLSTYSFSAGDRLRILGGSNGVVRNLSVVDSNPAVESGGYEGTPISNTQWYNMYYDFENKEMDVIQKSVDVEIVSSDGDWIYINPNAITDTDIRDLIFENTYKYVVFELYTPRQVEDDELYYNEIYTGDISELGTDITLDYGDSYVRNQYFVDDDFKAGYYLPTETQSVSDFYDSRQSALGVLNYINPDAKQDKYSAIRWGGVFHNNSNINEIGKFEGLNYKDLDAQHGDISALRQQGFTLLTFQRSKVSALYIGKTSLYKQDGSSDVVTTDNVFGDLRPYVQDWGTIFSQLGSHNNNMYLFDIYEGKMLRRTVNGLEDISGVMSTYFKDKASALLDSGEANIDVIMGYDGDNDMLLVTFLDTVDSTNNETIGFSEKRNVWMSFYSFIPEIYSKFGDNIFLSGKDGFLYKHNRDDVNRCTFYGTKYDAEIEVVSNINIPLVKLFDSVSTHSNKLWSVSDDDAITIPESSDYPNGMQSKITDNDFRRTEGIYKASFNRDMLTNGSTASVYDLRNGRLLRGRVINVRLKNSDNNEAWVLAVEINSRKSNQ